MLEIRGAHGVPLLTNLETSVCPACLLTNLETRGPHSKSRTPHGVEGAHGVRAQC
jgi:hypothetical protein